MLKGDKKVATLVFGIFLFIGAILPVTASAQSYEDSPFGFKDAYMLRVDLLSWWNEYPESMEDLGVFWHEPAARFGFHWHEVQDTLHTGGFSGYHWDHYDSLVLHAQDNNILISATIHASKPQFPEFQGHVLPSFPADMNAYRAFVNALVDRYDFDEQNDMPGLLYPISRWKIEDEAMASRYWGGTAPELAVLMTNAFEVVKDANSEASVISSMVISYIGLGGPGNQFMNEFFDELENLGGERPYDIMDIHYMPTDPNTPKREQYLQIQDLMNEVSLSTTSHGFPLAPYEALEIAGCNVTEQEQAEDLIRRYVYPLSIGFEKIFWSGIKAAVDADTTDPFVRNVLILDDGINKLSYYTYKLMVEKLEGSAWENIQTIDTGVESVYCYGFPKNDTDTYMAWYDYFSDPGYVPGYLIEFELYIVNIDSVLITQSVPDAENGNCLDPDDYPDFFLTETKPVIEGTVTVILGENPVFIEELSATSIEEEECVVGARLHQNSPNPFSLNTMIFFSTEESMVNTELVIYNISGRIVKTLVNSVLPEGDHSVSWNGTDENILPVGSGVYFCQLRSGNGTSESRRMVLLK